MVYKWRYDMKIPAQKAGEELERIGRECGAVTPRTVLDNSRNESDVLHSCFEWDDTRAAEKYRLKQASNLIQNLVVTVESTNTEPVRAFVNVGTKTNSSFVGVVVAMQDAQMREYVLKDALRELEAFRRKYHNLSELADVFAAVDKITA